MPPTPTPLPNVTTAPIMVDISLWDSAPTAVGVWNMAPDFVTITFQSLIILFLVLAVVMLVVKVVNRLTTDVN